MAELRLFIHIGLHKTGTTFMQRSVFPHWEGVDYLGKPHGASYLEKWLHRDSGNALLSNEQFSSAPVGAFLAEGGARWGEHRATRLDRLAAVFPQAAILMGVRPHADWVLSLYSQYLQFGGKCEVERFWAPFGRASPLSGEDLLIVPVIEQIARTWASQFVFSLEEIDESRRDLLFTDLATFFEVESRPKIQDDTPLNTRMTAEVAAALRARNRGSAESRARPFHTVAAMWRRATGTAAGSELKLPAKLRAEIDAFYADDWRSATELSAGLRRRAAA